MQIVEMAGVATLSTKPANQRGDRLRARGHCRNRRHHVGCQPARRLSMPSVLCDARRARPREVTAVL